MDNRGEVSQILSGITFDRNNIFDAEKATYSPENYIQVAFLRFKKHCSYQKLCHFEVLNKVLNSVDQSTVFIMTVQ